MFNKWLILFPNIEQLFSLKVGFRDFILRNVQTLCKIYIRFYRNIGYHSSDKTAFIQRHSLQEKDEDK